MNLSPTADELRALERAAQPPATLDEALAAETAAVAAYATRQSECTDAQHTLEHVTQDWSHAVVAGNDAISNDAKASASMAIMAATDQIAQARVAAQSAADTLALAGNAVVRAHAAVTDTAMSVYHELARDKRGAADLEAFQPWCPAHQMACHSGPHPFITPELWLARFPMPELQS